MFIIAFLLLVASSIAGVILLAQKKLKAGGIALGIPIGLIYLCLTTTDLFFIEAQLLLLVSLLVVSGVLFARKRFWVGSVVLAIFPALMGFFLIEAQLDRRSTPGHELRRFRGEDGIHQDMHDLAEDTKKTVDSAELQRWATAIMQATHQTNDPPKIMPDQVPNIVRKLVSGGLHLNYAQCDSSVDSVWIEWGGPFGHWGIRVGSPTFTVNSKSGDFIEYVEWKPGIYFWCETS